MFFVMLYHSYISVMATMNELLCCVIYFNKANAVKTHDEKKGFMGTQTHSCRQTVYYCCIYIFILYFN